MNELGSKGDLKSLVKELITSNIGEEIESISRCVFPIKDCYIRKVKVLKKPKFDVTALMEWHTDEATDTGAVNYLAPLMQLLAGKNTNETIDLSKPHLRPIFRNPPGLATILVFYSLLIVL